MSFRIVDHKKIDMTEHEYDMYLKIARSYDRPNFNGEDLFKDLFETDKDGIIIFLKPPSKQMTSLEVFLFLVSLMNQQHLRNMYLQLDDAKAQVANKLAKLDEIISKNGSK